MKKTWTPEMEEFLKIHYQEYGASKCAEILQKSARAVQSKALALGIGKKNRWTEQDRQFLRENFGIILTAQQCADKLNRTVSAVRAEAGKLGVRGRASGTDKKYSRMAIEWLDSFNNINIMHAENGGEHKIGIYQVDGYDPTTNTAYEFHGDAFHGNLNVFKPDEYCNPFDRRLTAKQLWDKTYQRMEYIAKRANLIFIWEHDYKNGRAYEQF